MKKNDNRKEIEVINYISSLEETLTGKELTFLKTVFYITKENYSSEQYLDIIQNCCETIFNWRDEGLSNRDLFQKMMKNVFTNVPEDVKEGVSLHSIDKNIVRKDILDAPEELEGLLSLFDLPSVDEDDFDDELKDEIFLRILRGEDKNEVASMYGLREDEVEKYYEEKLALVKNISMVDGTVFFEKEEVDYNRLTDKLQNIHKKIYGV